MNSPTVKGELWVKPGGLASRDRPFLARCHFDRRLRGADSGQLHRSNACPEDYHGESIGRDGPDVLHPGRRNIDQ
jgi:hypothetical protein